MPHVQLDTAVAGPIKYHYNISTPTETSAKKIVPDRPTIVFIHGVFLAQETFIAQFNDINLRRFNLVAFDLRSHGSTEGIVPDEYSPRIAAQDVVLLMDALELPPCHFFGLSMGSIIALQLAIDHPERVLSLFLLSPLGLAEPPEVAEGRQAIFDAWAQAFETDEPDQETLQFAVEGALELVSKDRHHGIMEAFVSSGLQQALTNWNKQHLKDFRLTTLDFIVKRKPRTSSEFAHFKAPVKLVHCLGDVAYNLSYSSQFLDVLKEAGVDVSLDTVPDASHFGCCEDAHLVNPILHDFIMVNTKTDVPAIVEGTSLSSPWNETLNWKDINDDSDEELLVI